MFKEYIIKDHSYDDDETKTIERLRVDRSSEGFVQRVLSDFKEEDHAEIVFPMQKFFEDHYRPLISLLVDEENDWNASYTLCPFDEEGELLLQPTSKSTKFTIVGCKSNRDCINNIGTIYSLKKYKMYTVASNFPYEMRICGDLKGMEFSRDHKKNEEIIHYINTNVTEYLSDPNRRKMFIAQLYSRLIVIARGY